MDRSRFKATLGACMLVAVLASVSLLPLVQAQSSGMQVTSPSFADGNRIPSKHTCDGADVSPGLSFSSVPSGAATLAMIVSDPDAPGGTFNHWVFWNLPGTSEGIPEGADMVMQGASEGQNDFGLVGYNGPCPPEGESHRYFFRLYALDQALDPVTLPPGSSASDLQAAMDGHILGTARLMGTYPLGGGGVPTPNLLPTADAGSDQVLQDSDRDYQESILLDASGSVDPDGTIVSFEWSLDGDSLASGVSPMVQVPVGSHNIALTVTDSDGATATDTTHVTVKRAPGPYSADGAHRVGALPTQREWGSAIWADGVVYYFGGFDQDSSTLYGSILAYDPEDHSVTDLSVTQGVTLPEPQRAGAAVWDSEDDAAYVFAESDCDGGSALCLQVTRFDPDTMDATDLTPRPRSVPSTTSGPDGLRGYSAVWDEDDGKAYVFGPADAVVRFDPVTEELQILAGLPATLDGASAVHDGEYAYLIGGESVQGDPPSDKIYRYNTTDDSFEELDAVLPDGGRLAMGVAWTGARAVLVGGADFSGAQPEFHDDIHFFDPTAGTVEDSGFDLQTTNAFTSMVWGDGHGHLLGGFGEAFETFNGIWSLELHEAPVADAGADQQLTAGSDEVATVQLDGSGSSDTDGLQLLYSWSEDGILLSDQESPTVQLPVGVHNLTLTVSDLEGYVSDDTVEVNVTAPTGNTKNLESTNQPPVADAGDNQTVHDADGTGNETVRLDGRDSTDDDEIVSYEWKDAAGAVIGTGEQPDIDLTVGNHTITLVVTDPDGAQASDSVTIRVLENAAPTAIIDGPGEVPDADGTGSEPVTLDASGSFDPDGHITSYRWTLDGESVSSDADFTMALPVGEHAFQLEVEDNGGKNHTATFTVDVLANRNPDAKVDMDNPYTANVSGYATVLLDGSGSDDPDGPIVSYQWVSPEGELSDTVRLSISLEPGKHRFELIVTDEAGETDAKAVTVQVMDPPTTDGTKDVPSLGVALAIAAVAMLAVGMRRRR